jgi:glycosyltransferase involved in cell wall biosynthesis
MPSISVVIPVYNGEKTIKQTIESVLSQTWTDFEIIIIDADSSDSTFKIVSDIKDMRIKVFKYSKANVAVNRNRGLAHASGKFITFLDADDLWLPDKLEAQYKALIQNPQAAVAYSWTNAIDENSQYLRPCSHANWTGDVYSKLLLDDFIGSGSNAMIRSIAFSKVGNFNESLTNAQDTDMWVRLAAHYHFVAVKKVQVLYRISACSMSSDILGLEASNLQIAEQSFAITPPKLKHLKPHRIANIYKLLCYKALSMPPGKHNTKVIARFLWQAVKTDLSLLNRLVIYKGCLKLAVMTLLPAKWANSILNKFPRLSNTTTFLGYIKVDLITD